METRSIKESDFLKRFREASRDHRCTLGDEEMNIRIADAWPAFDQAFNQIQRDMSRMTQDEATNKNLNAVFFAMSQLTNRLLEFKELGDALIEERKRKNERV